MRKYLGGLALLASVSSAHAAFWTGNELYRGCSEEPAYVLGYVTGILDKRQADEIYIDVIMTPEQGEASLEAKNHKGLLMAMTQGPICLPEKATSGQLLDVFCKYLHENPAERAKQGDDLVMDSMAKAFSCKK